MTQEQRIEKLGKRIEKVYDQASKEMTDKVNDFFADFQRLDAQKLALVKAGKMTQADYDRWRKNKILMSEKYMDLRDTMADSMLNANRIATSYINHELPETYAHNYNRVGQDVESKVAGYSFDLTDPTTIRNLSTKKKTLLPYKIKYVICHSLLQRKITPIH